MINQQVLEGRWNEISGKLRNKWGQLTQDELERAHGNIDQLVGFVQRKTGEARESIERFLDESAASGASAFSKAAENVRQYSHEAAEKVQETSKQATDALREGYEQAETMVKSRPAESMAVCFGMGLLFGVVVGLTLRPSR